MNEFEQALVKMRAGGVEGTYLFYKFAKEFFQKGGSNGLAGWVAMAFYELPKDAQLTMVCVALEARINEGSI